MRSIGTGGVWVSAMIGAAMLTATAWAAEGEGEGVDWTAKAKQAWTQTCKKCHTVPDQQFETGRAFLNQITETS